MLALAFFISVFSTLTWLIFSAAYINDHLGGVAFGALGITDISVYLALILLPILVLWMVFGFINQYLGSRTLSNNMFSLFKQMKKNQDYTDLIARIMLEAEQEIKDGFILGKFDLFIADMNELIADLLLRCNIASAEQIERLWTKVQNGGKWAFGKVLIEVNQNQPNFQMRVFEKSQRDNVIAGTGVVRTVSESDRPARKARQRARFHCDYRNRRFRQSLFHSGSGFGRNPPQPRICTGRTGSAGFRAAADSTVIL